MSTDMTTSMGNDPQVDDQWQDEGSPLDAAISTLDSYIQDPSLATKETLAQLKDQLVSAKEDIDGAMTSDGEDMGGQDSSGGGDFAAAIKARQYGGR